MANRADRRRTEKESSKTLTPTEQRLKDAETELDSGIHDVDESPVDLFIARLVIWSQFATQKTISSENYKRVHNLGGEKKVWIERYSESVSSMEFEEKELVSALKEMNEDEVEFVLGQRFSVPGVGSVGCSKSLANKLKEMLNHKETEDDS